MKTSERIPLLANVLTAVCKRPSAEVGKLMKAVLAYVNEGKRTDFESQYLEAYYDLLVLDIDTQRSAAGEKSRKCSESAKCRTAKSPVKPSIATKKTAPELVKIPANAEIEPTDADVEEVVSDANEADDVAQSFERLKAVYGRTGNNELQAFELWKNMSEEERDKAFANAQQKQGDPAPRSYLDIYLSNKQWGNTDRYGQATALF